VVVGDEQVAAAFGQAQRGVVHVQRDEPALQAVELLLQLHQPVREEGEGQGVRHRELDHVLPGHLVAAHHVAGGLQRAQHLQRLGVEGLARGVSRVG
jgi:hypothetical protein